MALINSASATDERVVASCGYPPTPPVCLVLTLTVSVSQLSQLSRPTTIRRETDHARNPIMLLLVKDEMRVDLPRENDHIVVIQTDPDGELSER
jgi:hypothetical protein